MSEKSAVFKVAYKFLGPDELEAFAAEEDPTKAWIHFIFTDDKPNANKERVPVEEFDNIIKTGKYMPIKKYVGETSSDHDKVLPMGTIVNLKRELGETKNIIEGLGTLWKKEFPEDVEDLKTAFNAGEPIDFSWEILYSGSDKEEEGVSALTGCRTRAITIVDLPAYQGRTRALAMASERKNQEEVDEMELLITGVASEEAIAAASESDKEAQRLRAAKYGIQIRPEKNVTKPKQYLHLSDSQFADPVNYAYPIDEENIRSTLRYWGKPENKAKYNARSRTINTQRMLAAAKRFGVKSIQESETTMAKKLSELLKGLEPADAVAAVSKELEEVYKELEALRTFKQEREDEEAKAVLLKSRLETMKEAGIEVKDDDLEKKAALWLSMDDEAFSFHVSELVAFSTAKGAGETAASTSVPDISGEVTDDDDDSGKVLREGLEKYLGRKSEKTEDK